MTEKRLKRPRDPVQLGKLIGDILTGQVEDRAPKQLGQDKDPAAVARGRLGGLRGGEVRAARLSVEARSEEAKLDGALDDSFPGERPAVYDRSRQACELRQGQTGIGNA